MNSGPIFDSGPGWGAKLGQWSSKNKLVLIPSIAILVLVLIIVSGNDDKPPILLEITPSSNSVMPLNDSNSELVQSKDNYTLIARRLVAKNASPTISNGARLYAETKLAQDFKSQPLMVGGTITYDINTIQAYLVGFDDLYPIQKTKWEDMAKNVKF